MLKVKYADNFEEEFIFTRKRYSIPVITQGGVYWAKYNMRGNSKSYEDQIGFDRDISRNELYTYLQTCSDEEFIYYTGASYRGTSTEGLYLKRFLDSNDEPTLFYDGYDAIPDGQVSNGSADLHCPPGYRMPALSEWQQIFYTGGSLNIPGHGNSNSYNTSINSLIGNQTNRYRIDRYTREITIDGVLRNVSIFNIVDVRYYQGEEMVFIGFGTQKSPTSMTWGEIVIPICTGSYSHFLFNYNTNKTSYGNLSGTGVQTRVIRCVKSPTNFIVE